MQLNNVWSYKEIKMQVNNLINNNAFYLTDSKIFMYNLNFWLLFKCYAIDGSKYNYLSKATQ